MFVSVYVPCYNGAAWLHECLTALLAQTYQAGEVLVIDDGSTDDSAAIARALGGAVQLVQHMRNRGLAVARNTALAAAQGEIVASVDADVRAAPDWLAHLLQGFQSPRVAAVGGRLLEWHQTRLADRWRAAHMAQHAGDRPQTNPPVLPGANTAVRRQVVQRLGGYDESFRTNYEDTDLQHRLLESGYLCRYEPAALAHHLRTDSARSVLRTYWGWLRPPFERRGAFLSLEGVTEKIEADAAFARRALWDDFTAGGQAQAYLSLLVMLALPAADLAHAAQRAIESQDHDSAALWRGRLKEWLARLPHLVEMANPAVASVVASDLQRVGWWLADGAVGGESDPHMVDGLLGPVKAALAAIPKAWWPTIREARNHLATEEGWPGAPASPRRVTQARTPPNRLTGHAGPPRDRYLDDALHGLVSKIVQRVPDTLAILRFDPGRTDTRERAGEVRVERHDEPVSLLAVARTTSGVDEARALYREVAGWVSPHPLRLKAIESYRLGWLPPSLFQQALLANAALLWGDPSVLRVIPSWRPEQIDPRAAFDRLDEARNAARDGKWTITHQAVLDALLLAKRGFTPVTADQPAALARAWPELESAIWDRVAGDALIDTASQLIRDWLFIWEGEGPSDATIEGYLALRRMAQAAATSSGSDATLTAVVPGDEGPQT